MAVLEPKFLAQGSQLEGPGCPLLDSIALHDCLWVAARFTPDTVHVFAGSTLCHILQFPEDLLHIEFGHLQTESTHQAVCLLVITEACRAWLLDLTKTISKTDRGDGAVQQPGVSMQQLKDSRSAAERQAASSTTEEPLEVQWQALPADACATDLPVPLLAPSSLAAVLTPLTAHLGGTSRSASLANQVAWEHAADVLQAAADTKAPGRGLFFDLSALGRAYSQDRPGAAGAPATGTVCALAVTPGLPSLRSVTCSLNVRVHAAPGAHGSGSRDGLQCRSRASLSPELLKALLGTQHQESVRAGASCLLVGASTGRVWAHPLGSSSLKHGAGSSEADKPYNDALSESVLLFDIQQPVLSLYPVSLGAAFPGSSSQDGLLIIGQHGHVVLIGMKPAEPASLSVQQQEQQQPVLRAISGRAEPSASLEVRQMRIQGPVVSAAVSQGILYYTAGGAAHAAVLSSAGGQPNAPTAESAGELPAASRKSSFHELQPVQLHCFGQCAHLLSTAEPCHSQNSAMMRGALSGSTIATLGSLVMLCTNGCLFTGPLVPAEAISAARPCLPSSRVQAQVKVMALH